MFITKPLSIALLGVLGATAAFADAPEISASRPRDPIIFQPDAYADFLQTLSVSPEVRISVSRGRLTYFQAYTLARSPRPSTRRIWAPPLPSLPTGPRQGDQLSANRELVYRTAVSFAVDPDYFLPLANRESRFDHLAKAPTSSAAGLFQFTENTWLCVLKQYGARYAVVDAPAIRRGWDGRCRPETGEARWRLLALRYDASLNATMAALHTRDNRQALLRVLGREPTGMELYAYHFFGEREAQRFLRARSGDIGADVTPKAASSNRSLFYSRHGRPLQIIEIERNLRRTFMQL